MCDYKKKSDITTNVDIHLGNDFVTNKAAVNVLLAIAKFLLFNRSQIPFVYETFYYMANKLEKAKSMHNKSGENVCNTFVKSYAMERQRDIAIQTYRKFKEISDVLNKSFDRCDFEQAIIMFGATPFTAKEAFFINLPFVTRNHFAANHLDSTETISRKVIRSIVTSKSFFDVNCSELRPTNMYVVLKPKYGWNTIGDQFTSHTGPFRLPASCRRTHINIQNDFKIMDLNCCQNINIFNDVNAANDNNAMDNLNWNCSESKKQESETASKIKTQKCSSDCDCYYYECKIIVKGFKDQLIKGQSIWLNNVSL